MANIDSRRSARQDLHEHWIAAGSPSGEFRTRQVRIGTSEGWWRMFCVDAGEKRIRGVRSVQYRPLMTDTGGMFRIGEAE